MECSRCGRQIPEEQSYAYEGKVLCEDCLMEIGLHPKECEPWATYLATRGKTGIKGKEGLTDSQKKVYEFIQSKGKTTRDEVKDYFKFSEAELDAQLTALLHAELVKQRAAAGKLFLAPVN